MPPDGGLRPRPNGALSADINWAPFTHRFGNCRFGPFRPSLPMEHRSVPGYPTYRNRVPCSRV